MSSLLATRCEAYKVLYEQLVRHVGTEGRPGASSSPTLIFNTNSNTVDASPVTTNTNTTTASSKSKAVNRGVGAAAIAAVALGAVLMMRTLTRSSGGPHSSRRGGDRGDRGDREKGGGKKRPALPRGRNGREMLLVSTLSSCGDELRKAARNDALLQDDWRLGKLRLAWPPAPVPPGYVEMAPDGCDVTGVLQEMYGR